LNCTLAKFWVFAVLPGLLAALACREGKPAIRTVGADVPLHLEDHLDAARIAVPSAPGEIVFGDAPAGTCSLSWGRSTRRALYAHVPGRLEYRLKVPEKGRLDFGFRLLKSDPAVKLRISAREGEAEPVTLLETAFSGENPRLQHSVGLSRLAGKTVTLSLETEAERPGNVAFWAAPMLSGDRTTGKPNIILYVIDGAAAELMSIYGYKRRTTRHLERLAAEGAVFENAYSNSSITKVSVPSFMTSLHSSVMGGLRSGSDTLPEQAVSMAERLHRAGYVTEVLTSNPYCGRLSGLERGVDVMMDTGQAGDRPSSADLHREFWRLREEYPGEPYWVHFQPTDAHRPWNPTARFAGLFTAPARSYEVAKHLYDECMAFQDRTIDTLVRRLKERGEWDRTLFIVAADHSHMAAGLPLRDPGAPSWGPPLLASQMSRIRMIFVWPGKIAPGRRISEPVSMIDMLPTVLDLAGLPRPKIAQGRSLAPLLLGKSGWKPRPVVFDEFRLDGNCLYGSIELIDGRWGASLRIDPRPDDLKTTRERLRPAPLLIFDVGKDSHAFHSLNEERPDLVEKYAKMLGRIWKEHRALAAKFSRAGNAPMTPDQIETLRSLGYLR
jgi:arylsulfatase A-like enzyme